MTSATCSLSSGTGVETRSEAKAELGQPTPIDGADQLVGQLQHLAVMQPPGGLRRGTVPHPGARDRRTTASCLCAWP